MESLSEFLGAKPAAPAAAGADPLDFSDRYNTPIPAARQSEFEAWRQDRKQKFGRDPVGDRYDYDVNGLFLSGQGSDERGHSSDQFKKPNHPTFSDESIYHGKDGYSGGHWGQDSSYTASPTNLKMRSAPELQKYFAENEPKSKLNLPAAAPAGAAQSLGDFLADPLNGEHSSAESLPSQAQFDQANQTVIQKLRARLAPAIAATEKAASGFFDTPTQMTPGGKALNEKAAELENTVNEHGVIRPFQDALRPPTQYNEPEPTSTAGKIAQGAGEGLTRTAEGLTTPTNLALGAAAGGLGLIPKIGALLPKAASVYFGAEMFKAAYDKIPEAKAAIDKGDAKGAAAAITEGLASGVLGTMAAFHVAGGRGAETKAAERGTAPRQKLSDFLAEEQPAPAVGKESLPTETAPIATPAGKPKMPGSTGGVKGSEELPLVTDIIKPGTEKPVLSRAETLKPEVAKTLQERTLRSNPDGTEEVLRKVPLDQISPAKPTEGRPQGNVIYGDTVEKYKNAEWTPPVELRRNGPDDFETWEGHHRIEAARDRGDKSIMAWTRDADQADNTPADNTPAAEPLAPSTEVLERVANKEDGTEAVIAKTPAGFSVSLRDTDADRATGIARIYPTIEQAREYANTVKTPAREAAKPKVPEVPRPQDVENASVQPESKPVVAKATSANNISAEPGRAADNISGEIPLPGSVREMPTKSLKVDPLRFQFKQNVGQGGAGEELRGVQKFDPEKSGILSVWHDPADGETYVVNGHNRHALADRTGAPTMTVRYLEAKDAKEARTKGALINIAEGRGDAVDAAKVFRDSGMNAAGLEREGVSLKGEKARQGLALSKLDPHLFSRVVAGDIPVERASIIGEGLENPDDQRALYDLVEASDKKGKYISNGRLGEMIRMTNAETAKHTETQVNLFGEQEAKRSLISEKADVSDYVRNRLSQEKRLFAAVGKESAAAQLSAEGNEIKAGKNAAVAERTGAAQAIYDKLSVTTGAVNDALNRAAARIAKGESTNAVKESAYSEIRGALLEQARRLTGGNEIPAERPQGDAQGRPGEVSAREHDQARFPNPVIKSVEDARTAAEKIKVIRENAIARNEAARREAAARRSKFARNDDAKAARRAAADKASGATVAEPPKGNSAKAWAEYRKAQQGLVGKYYESYGGGIDKILKVDHEKGNREYTVSDSAGRIRTHATPISRAWDTAEAARAAAKRPNLNPSRPGEFSDPFDDFPKSRVPRLPFEHAFKDYVEGLSDKFHGKNAYVEPMPLTPEESKYADAMVLNSSALEYWGRAAGHTRDEVPQHMAGAHIGNDDAKKMARNLAMMSGRDFGPNIPEGLNKLGAAVHAAAQAGKSFIVINGHAAFEPHHGAAVAEELAHSVQSAIKGSTRGHMGEQMGTFLADPLAVRGREALARYEKTRRNDNSMAVEIGVRLMYPGAYKELKLEPQEARDLGAKYVRALRKEYGSEKPRDIARKVFDNVPPKSLAQRGAQLEGPGSEGRGGTTERARSDLSGNEGKPGADDRDRSAREPEEQPRNKGDQSSEHPIRLIDREGQGGLFRDHDEIARANQRDRDKLTKEKLEAQLKGPISRAEQVKKLKRDKSNNQGDLFSGPAPEKTQGSLFDGPEPEREQGGLFDSHIPKEDEAGRNLEAIRLAQRARSDNPKLQLSEFSKALRDRFPSMTSADAVRVWNRAAGGERGGISAAAIGEVWRGSRGQDLLDIGKRLGTRIREQGDGAGADLMKMVERAELEGGVDAGKRMVRWADAEPSRLSRDQRFDLVDALEGRTGPPKDPQVLRAFEAARGITDEIAGDATARGVYIRTKEGPKPFAALKDYFPHTMIANEEALSGGPVRKDVVSNIVRQGIQPNEKAAGKMVDDWLTFLKSGKKLDSILDYLVNSGQAPDKAAAYASLREQRDNIRRQGNIEYARELDLPFYDPNPLRVLPRVIAGASRRLNQITQFGQEHEKINREILKIAQRGGDADFVSKSIDRIVGNIEGGETPEARVARFAMALETLKLPYVGLQHATQGINTLLATDMPTLAAGMAAAFGKAGKRFSVESGAGAEPAIRDALRQAGGDSRLTDKYLRATGLTGVMRFNRALAANTGAKWAKKNFQMLARGGKAEDVARSRLANAGIDVDQAIQNGGLSDRDFLRAAKSMSDFTMFRNRPQDMPDLFTATPIGRVLTQFKHWGYLESTMVADQIKRDFKEGKGRGLRTLLVLATVFPAAGAAVTAIKDKLNGTDREFDSAVEGYVHSLFHSSALGMAGEAVNSATSHHTLEFLAGPVAGDVAALSDIFANQDLEAGEKLDALKKYAIQRFAGPAKQLLSDD